LLDSDGKLKSFEHFANDVQTIEQHKRQYLQTEYDTAILRAHQAADWQRFERDRDLLPNLRWMPTTSPNPDSIHQQFWAARLTLPQDHSFWDLHQPGDRWNCKCYLEATDEPVRAERVAENNPQPYKPAPGLDSNPGKDASLFNNKTHPYSPPGDTCAACPFYKNKPTNALTKFFNSAPLKHCNDGCEEIDGVIEKAKR